MEDGRSVAEPAASTEEICEKEERRISRKESIIQSGQTNRETISKICIKNDLAIGSSFQEECEKYDPLVHAAESLTPKCFP